MMRLALCIVALIPLLVVSSKDITSCLPPHRNAHGRKSGKLTKALIRSSHGTYHMAVRDVKGGRGDTVSKFLLADGAWEMNSPENITQMTGTRGWPLPAGGTFLDVGGNLGYYSFLFAQYGYTVHALEPMSHNRRAMETTLCLNPHWRDRVHVHPVAAAAKEQQCVMFAPVGNVGNGYMECQNLRNYGRDLVVREGEEPRSCASFASNQNIGWCEDVRARPLDVVIAEAGIEAVDVVKMDIEGFECEAMRGGQSLFTRLRPKYVFVEAQFPGVRNCTRMQARRHGYRLLTSGDPGAARLGENVLMVRRH